MDIDMTFVDQWSLLHFLLPFLLGFIILYRVKPIYVVLGIVLLEIIENTLLESNPILMAHDHEALINIVGDIIISTSGYVFAVLVRAGFDKR